MGRWLRPLEGGSGQEVAVGLREVADLRCALVGEATILGDGCALGREGRRAIQDDTRVWS